MARTKRSRGRLMLLVAIPVLCFPASIFAQATPTKGMQSSATSQPSTADLQSLREENQRLRQEVEALKASVAELQKKTEAGGALKITPGTAIEYGSVLFEKGRKQHSKKVLFRNTYKAPPVVLVCASGSSGDWVLVASEKITTTQATLSVQGKFNYECQIGYLVVGEAEAIAARPTQREPQVKPGEPPKTQPPSPPQRITWQQYRQDCGVKAQEVNQAKTEEVFRTKYEGKAISWEGTVVSVREGLFGGPYSVHVKMEPSESLGSDLTLSVPVRFKDTVLSLRKGSILRFEGSIVQQGGVFLDHMIDVSGLEKKR